MRVVREELKQHLDKVTCGGQIAEAVFTGAFAAQVMSLDQLLIVLAPPLERTEPLPEAIGVPDLGKLVKALSVVAGPGSEGEFVEIGVKDHRLILDEEHRGKLRLLLAGINTIGTRIEDPTVKKLTKQIPKGKGIPLTRAFIDGVRATFSLFKAVEVELFLGPRGGRVQVGSETSDIAVFESKELKSKKAYSLLFGKHFVDVLSVVTNYSEVRLLLGGPEGFAVIQDGEYQFILGPRTRGKEAASGEASTEEVDNDLPF